ncbi:MAG TPA: FAD-dependent oxidoreductase [Azospirillaceae bacterium]|nr:FAD-dependent oxidoreductase [Azospirillaceae bacterium]
MQGTGTTTSVWMATSEMPEGDKEAANERLDVLVVGAGIAGLTTALLLQREGRSVLVVDDGPAGSGETSRTTAHLSNAIDDRYTEIERMHGAEAARLAADSHTAAIDRIESLAKEEVIDCDFARLDGYLIPAEGHSSAVIDQELEAAHRAGLTAVERVDHPPLMSAGPGPCLRFPNQGMFHPLKYLNGLLRAFTAHGGRLVSGVHVNGVSEGKPAKVTTDGGPTFYPDAVVVATNTPVNDWVKIHTKQAAYRTYAVALRVPQGSVPTALYWDTADPYHYVRLQPMDDHDLLIVGGEDHKTGEARDQDERWARLEGWTREHFPMAQAVEFQWSGQVMEPFDGLAYIGRNPGSTGGNIYIATGDSGMGMTHGTIAGMLLTDLIQGRDNPWTTVYDPARKPFSALGTFLKENLDVARQYSHYLRPAEVGNVAEIRPGTGAVVRENGQMVAAYRADDGTVTRLSAVCTHMQCVVQWNPGERTWDCPCHGSRFTTEGALLNGPAVSPLAHLSTTEAEERKTG